MKKIYSLILLLNLTLPVQADEIKKVDMIDFLVDTKSFEGKKITITECTVNQASIKLILCSVVAGGVFLQTKTINRDDLKRALRTCSEVDDDGCVVEATGTVAHSAGRFYQLKNATLKWKDAETK